MQKRISIKAIADMAGCSISTVSHVLNNNTSFFGEDTRKRVMEIVEKTHYTLNSCGRNLRTGKTETIGLVFYRPNTDIFKSEFYLSMMYGFQKKLSESGYDLLLSELTKTQIEEKRLPSFIGRSKADALVALGGFPQIALDKILKANMPTVMLDSFHPQLDSILTNGRKASSEIVKYLYSCGHRHIEYFLYGNGDYNSNMRAKGFEDAVKNLGLDQKLCVVHNDLADNSGAAAAMEKTLSQKKVPTAIMGANDCIVTFLMSYAQAKGIRVPSDISFFGFDDVLLATRCTPQLSTVHTDTNLMGEVGAEIILERLKNPDMPKVKKVFEVPLVFRDSVKKLAR